MSTGKVAEGLERGDETGRDQQGGVFLLRLTEGTIRKGDKPTAAVVQKITHVRQAPNRAMLIGDEGASIGLITSIGGVLENAFGADGDGRGEDS